MGMANTALSENAFNKSKREPMFVFVLDEVLSQFKSQTPHFEPLFQLPDRFATRHKLLLFACCARDLPTKEVSHFNVQPICGGGVPHTPS